MITVCSTRAVRTPPDVISVVRVWAIDGGDAADLRAVWSGVLNHIDEIYLSEQEAGSFQRTAVRPVRPHMLPKEFRTRQKGYSYLPTEMQ
eukprot:779935-Pleurochrysis_carterae.AAC.1